MKERVLMCLVLLVLVISQVACGFGSDDIVGYWEYVEPSAGRSTPESMEFYSMEQSNFGELEGKARLFGSMLLVETL